MGISSGLKIEQSSSSHYDTGNAAVTEIIGVKPAGSHW